MEKPTEAQIKGFWEWCGIHHKGSRKTAYLTYPELNLNNLFKYAVPFIRKKLNYDGTLYKFHNLLKRWVYTVAIKKEDPALALFWAIWKITPHNPVNKGGKR